MGMEFRTHRARVLKASRASLEDGDDGDGADESSWNTLPLATEENLQRMVTSLIHLFSELLD